eukprot:223697_1
MGKDVKKKKKKIRRKKHGWNHKKKRTTTTNIRISKKEKRRKYCKKYNEQRKKRLQTIPKDRTMVIDLQFPMVDHVIWKEWIQQRDKYLNDNDSNLISVQRKHLKIKLQQIMKSNKTHKHTVINSYGLIRLQNELYKYCAQA